MATVCNKGRMARATRPLRHAAEMISCSLHINHSGPGRDTATEDPMFRRATLTTGVVIVLTAALTGCASGRAAWTAPPGEVTTALAIAEPATHAHEAVSAAEDDVVGE